MVDWFHRLFEMIEAARGLPQKKMEPVVVEHRGMKGYFTVEMLEEFKREKIDYEKAFREAVDEALEDSEEEDPDNPYR